MSTPDGTARFEGKVALVTGAARGFGRAFAEGFAREGAAVALADVDDAGVARAAEELRAAGHPAIGIRCDVADEGSVDAAVAHAVAELGGIDVLVNNAGKHLMRYNQPFSVLPREELRALFDVNVMGVVNCSLACLEPMRARGGGAIVNISSMASYASRTPYGVSKLAVRGLTIAFAAEFAAAGVRCNAISPGLVATESAMADLPPEIVRTIVEDQQLVKRLGRVDDVVAMTLHLCSAEAGFVTGETVKVSGGTPLWI